MSTHPAETPLRHGYTFNHIHAITLNVVRIDRWRKDGDIRDRYDAIRYTITEHILTADEAPTRRQLINLGLRAANAYVDNEMRHHGYDKRRIGAGAGSLLGFQRYWQKSSRRPFDESVIERMALTQVWPALTLVQRQALMALALTGDYEEAAESLSLTRAAFAGRMYKARARVHALWHEHETPRRQPRDHRVFNRQAVDGRGKRRLTESDLENIRERRAAGATLRVLALEYGYTAGGLCNLLNGKKKPASTRWENADA